MSRSVILLSVFSVLLSACDTRDAQPDRKAPQTHVWQDQVKTIDKARAVQKTVDDQATAQKQQIDDQTH